MDSSHHMPVEILGMNDSAFAGAEFLVTETEDKAKEIADFRTDSSSSTSNALKAKDKTTLFENKIHHEILVVNDSSTDNTLGILENIFCLC